MWHALAANYFWLGVLQARVTIRVRTVVHDGRATQGSHPGGPGGCLILRVYWPAVSEISYIVSPGISDISQPC